jgi:hypothetical protein
VAFAVPPRVLWAGAGAVASAVASTACTAAVVYTALVGERLAHVCGGPVIDCAGAVKVPPVGDQRTEACVPTTQRERTGWARCAPNGANGATRTATEGVRFKAATIRKHDYEEV